MIEMVEWISYTNWADFRKTNFNGISELTYVNWGFDKTHATHSCVAWAFNSKFSDSSLPLIEMKVGRFNDVDDTDSECGWNGRWIEENSFLLMFSEAGANGTYTKNINCHCEILTAVSLCSIPGRGISEGARTFVCVGVLLLAWIHQPCLRHSPTPYHPVWNSSMIFVRSRNVFLFSSRTNKAKAMKEPNWNKTQKRNTKL